MTELFFAGKITLQVDEELYWLGLNHLFSYLNDKRHIDKWIDLVKKNGKKGQLFIDSGAFTAWTQNKYIAVDDYIDFINDRYEYIDYYGQLDAIPGTLTQKPTTEQVKIAAKQTWENFLYMYSKMKNPQGLMYTFHVGEPFSQLEIALNWRDSKGNAMRGMALGGMVGKNRQTQLEFIDKCFNIIKNSTNPNIQVHAFGLIAPKVLNNFPFYSADSAGWLQCGQNGSIYVPQGIVVVSDQQITKKEHLYNNPASIESVKKFVESNGYTLEQLSSSYSARSVFNALFLVNQIKTLAPLKNKVSQRRLF